MEALAEIDCRNCIAAGIRQRQFLPYARKSSKEAYIFLLRPLKAAARIFCLLMRLLHLILKRRGAAPVRRFPCCAMTESSGSPPARVPDIPLLHTFKNHLSVIIGFCDLLLNDLPEDDPKRADVLEVRKAGQAAIALLPELSERMR